MKYVFLFLIIAILVACRGSRSAGYSDQKDLSALIKRMNKRGDDGVILQDIKQVYGEASYKAGIRLQSYDLESAPGKWDKIIPELQSLQQMHDIILRSAYAFKNVQPVNYISRIQMTRDSAASGYYQYASSLSADQSRRNKHRMYDAYAKAVTYVPDYQDARTRMNELYQSSIIKVLINPVQSDLIGLGFSSLPLFNRRIQELYSRLIQDLGGQAALSIPAKFYTPTQLGQTGVGPDQVVDLVWRNVRIDNPVTTTRSYNRSKQVETGKDSANRPVYTTVYATVFANEQSENADGTLHLLINETASRSQLIWNQFPATYKYTFEWATYTGDRRALTDQDWVLINKNRNQQMPSSGEMYAGLLEQVYQSVLNRIRQTANW